MPEIRELNISIELWSMAFCAVCIVCCLMLIRVRSRQRALEFAAAGCGALEVASVPGEGTRAVMRIPKQEGAER